ncbi:MULTISPECIES: SRPBCC family protein [Arthrobacter]|uniref:SRPBCC family protein n=1 Tax=Arthrobacter terricola TaxID=2547396 RepID=A0A4R5K6W9_9MICC|nr:MULTISPECIES: SRPBCC family protein [Arthrobacter]MBT8161718.1 SRPBCC family protein [Arthrobacter sp. GN70]TDF89402.1 SRPBCC family protein [Arthrobacter terricola]
MPITDESIVIPVPPEEVFDYLNDPAHLPECDVRANLATLSENLTEHKNHKAEE